MTASAIPGDSQAKWAAGVDLGLDGRECCSPRTPGVEIADDLQRLIEEPRLVALRAAAILAARALIHRDVRDRALGLTARRIVVEIDRGRDCSPAPLGLLLRLHREADR